MTIPVWLALLGTGLTVLGLQWRFATRIARIELKVDTVWDFIIRRAQVEVVNVGWGTKKSPLVLNPATLQSIMPFIVDIVAFYARLIAREPQISERELFIAIERQFGERIVETVCIPHKVNLGACIVAVLEACKLSQTEKAE
jgi:hypothetical protein